jgi:hypothetical protein
LRKTPGNAEERIVSRENVLGAFRELARAAGRCLTDLPTEMKGLSPGVAEDPRLEVLHTIHDRPGDGPSLEWVEADYWLIILHRLGWQAYGRRPGSLPAVRPSLWEWSGGGFEPAALDIERREDEMFGQIDENSIFVAEEQDERDLLLSCLPFDVFQGSAYAIDTILQMDRDDSTSRPRDAGQSVVASGSMVRTDSTNEDDSDASEPPVGNVGDGSPAEATHGAGQNRKLAIEPRARIPQAETEIRVREHLKKHPDAKLREIIKKTGVSQGAAAKTSAWKAARTTRKSQKRKSEVRTRPLTSEMLASLEDHDGSLCAPDVHEILSRQFIEHMSEKERASFFAGSKEDQRLLLEIYADQVKNG